MKLLRRNLRGEADLQAMAALARACPEEHLHVMDLPYRFSSWALDDPANASLWLTPQGELVAWAALQGPFWAIDHARRAGLDGCLGREIWAWADSRARALLEGHRGLPAWYASAFAGQAGLIRELEEAGFACQSDAGEDSWSKVWMRRPGEPAGDGAVPAGFAIRPLAGEGEAAACAELQREVFGTRNMTEAWRARTLRRPEYLPELDLVAEGPQGRLAAFCLGWLDRRNPEGPAGQVEPMGVREEARHLGLGRAILAEALRRLMRHGARQVYVETDNYRDAAFQLYEAAGFRVIRNVLVFRRSCE